MSPNLLRRAAEMLRRHQWDSWADCVEGCGGCMEGDEPRHEPDCNYAALLRDLDAAADGGRVAEGGAA